MIVPEGRGSTVLQYSVVVQERRSVLPLRESVTSFAQKEAADVRQQPDSGSSARSSCSSVEPVRGKPTSQKSKVRKRTCENIQEMWNSLIAHRATFTAGWLGNELK